MATLSQSQIYAEEGRLEDVDLVPRGTESALNTLPWP